MNLAFTVGAYKNKGVILSDFKQDSAGLQPAAGGQFQLLGQRRFAPFFWTQFLGAANDNLFKFALTVLVTYHLGDAAGQGFLHGFAGVLLFVVALLTLFALDGILGYFVQRTSKSDP